MVRDLIVKSRSYRRFRESEAIDKSTMRDLVDLARLSPTGGNMQPLKFMIAHTPEQNQRIFPHLAWAGYLKDWPGPSEGERPAAYVVVLGDTQISRTFGCDHGIAAQSILLGAREKGLAGCMIGLIQREELRTALDIPTRYEILLVIALGKPREQIVLEDVGPDGDIKYRRDSAGVHHVPKRSLKELIIG